MFRRKVLSGFIRRVSQVSECDTTPLRINPHPSGTPTLNQTFGIV